MLPNHEGKLFLIYNSIPNQAVRIKIFLDTQDLKKFTLYSPFLVEPMKNELQKKKNKKKEEDVGYGKWGLVHRKELKESSE